MSSISAPHPHWFSKVEPLATHIRNACKSCWTPSSNVSVDEMICRFSGRSQHTMRMKGKPIPSGYVIYSLCDAGYTWTFEFYSRVEASPHPRDETIGGEVANLVYHLATQLPHRARNYNVYMDNYFSSVELFRALRKKNIGACGTVRTNSKGFPAVLRVEKSAARYYQWDTLSAVVVGEEPAQVLASVWIDNGPVTMLTTVHRLDGADARIERDRRRPRDTSTNAARVREVFGNQSRRKIPIPKMIDDYNHYMGGVDIADQLRAYYSVQLKAERTWMPLFFWLIDVSLVNAYMISKTINKSDIDQISFRRQLVWELVTEALREDVAERSAEKIRSRRGKYVTAARQENWQLAESRHAPGPHIAVFATRKHCYMCRLEGRSKCSVVTQCGQCGVHLCLIQGRNCFEKYHTL